MRWINFNVLTSVLLIISVLACREPKSHYVKIHKYPTGELLSKISYSTINNLKDGQYEEYYKNGVLKKVTLFKNGQQVDSALRYYPSGKLEYKEIISKDTTYGHSYFQNGKIAVVKKFLNQERPVEICWTLVFDKYGAITDSIQHIELSDTSYANQWISYRDGQIVLDSSNFFRFNLDSIPNSELFGLKISYEPKIPDSDVFFILGDKLNDDFSNIGQIDLDTIFMQDNTISSNSFKRPSKRFKGFFYEYGLKELENVGQDSIKIRILENRTYFNLVIKAKKAPNR